MSLYLKGRCHLQKGNYSRAENLFLDVFRFLDKNDFYARHNVKAFCYYDYARLFYYNNDFKNALSYTLKGIDAFKPNEPGVELIHSLKISKAIYLEKLDRYEESLRAIDELWEDSYSIKNIFVLLNMYETKAFILKKQKMQEEAIKLAYEGIDIARVNKVPDRLFDLYTLLGSIYMELNDLDEAEDCILTALDFKNKVKKEYLLIGSYTLLGRIRMKQERWEESLQYLQEAVRIGEKTNDAKRLGWALIALGDWYQTKEMYSEGVDAYQKALEIGKLKEIKKLHRIALLELSKCWKHIDRSEFVTSLENLFDVEVQLVDEREF